MRIALSSTAIEAIAASRKSRKRDAHDVGRGGIRSSARGRQTPQRPRPPARGRGRDLAVGGEDGSVRRTYASPEGRPRPGSAAGDRRKDVTRVGLLLPARVTECSMGTRQ